MSQNDASHDDVDASKAPLIEHLTELRTRLMWSIGVFILMVAVCYPFSGPIFAVLAEPLRSAIVEKCNTQGLDLETCFDDRFFQYTAVHEAFFTQLKIAMFGGLFISFPFLATQLWLFIAPGLYKNERQAFLPFLAATPILFLMGTMLLYFIVLPMAMSFFLGFEMNNNEGVQTVLQPKMNEYLEVIMTLVFAFGISFQLPVALTLMGRAGLITSDGLKRNRKFAIVAAFAAAALLTPPDPISQIGLGLPILLLYEVSIWTTRFYERRLERQRAAEA